jgi:DNA repair protein RadC
MDDRPREKFLSKGKLSLSDTELLAILINTGTKSKSALDISREILNSCKGSLNQLSKLTISELVKIGGIGHAKAVTIAAAIELGLRHGAGPVKEQMQILSSRHTYEYARQFLVGLSFEQFWVIFLNRASRIIAEKMIGEGGISQVAVDIKKIFIYALEYKASSIICFHNHPSGNLQPSHADIQLTKQLKNAAKIIEIGLLDHLIITENGYYSFADEGEL